MVRNGGREWKGRYDIVKIGESWKKKELMVAKETTGKMTVVEIAYA